MPRHIRAGLGLTLLTTLTTGAFAVPAFAASTGVVTVVESTVVRYKAAKGKQNAVVVTRSGRTITVDDRVAITAGKGCKKVKGDKTKVRCTTKKAPTRVRVYTYDRNDTIVNRTGLGSTLDGGTGNDKVTGGPRADILRGDRGADQLWGLGGNDRLEGGNDADKLYGGDGKDWIEDGYGNDLVRGGNGDDYVFSGSGNDRFHGDAGTDWFALNEPIKGSYPTDNDYVSGGSGGDTVHYWYQSPVTVDLDGATGDDGMKGERDTIAADVEGLVGGAGNDRLTGSNGDNSLEGAAGKDVIHGLGGRDRIDGQQGADTMYGGAGPDYLIGDDSVDGNAADLLDGGADDDACDLFPKDTAVNCETKL
ncbi:calcium-binding protein [Actinoplanes missouriensis]|uniref:calcium-binding protein n=1 Tax=Actinoplanes missouriensis TaxID=1866 RepID=UPI0002E1F5C2|nr:calcium-binding protein [Actinoplanes missouriensis]